MIDLWHPIVVELPGETRICQPLGDWSEAPRVPKPRVKKRPYGTMTLADKREYARVAAANKRAKLKAARIAAGTYLEPGESLRRHNEARRLKAAQVAPAAPAPQLRPTPDDR